MTCAEKRRFATKIEAVARAVALNNRNGQRVRRAYKCGKCGAWHLTHKVQPWEKGKHKSNNRKQEAGGF